MKKTIERHKQVLVRLDAMAPNQRELVLKALRIDADCLLAKYESEFEQRGLNEPSPAI